MNDKKIHLGSLYRIIAKTFVWADGKEHKHLKNLNIMQIVYKLAFQTYTAKIFDQIIIVHHISVARDAITAQFLNQIIISLVTHLISIMKW